MEATLPTTLCSLDALEPHPENPNQGDLLAIQDSIRTNGWFGVVVTQIREGAKDRILAGEHRWRALAALQSEYETIAEALASRGGTLPPKGQVPTYRLAISDDQALRILLADNRTTRLGQDDETRLLGILQLLHESEDVLAGTGYLEEDFEDLLAALDGEDTWQEDPAPDPEHDTGDLKLAGTKVTIGPYTFPLSRDDFEAWQEEVRQAVGFDKASIIQEIKRRLLIGDTAGDATENAAYGTTENGITDQTEHADEADAD